VVIILLTLPATLFYFKHQTKLKTKQRYLFLRMLSVVLITWRAQSVQLASSGTSETRLRVREGNQVLIVRIDVVTVHRIFETL
jgi:hypothetical protein